MKQKMVIILSLLLFLAAIGLIVSDLFQPAQPAENVVCCGDDLSAYKKIDSAKIGYIRINRIPTGLKGLHAIAVDTKDNIWVGGDQVMAVFRKDQDRPPVFRITEDIQCLAVQEEFVFAGAGSQLIVFSREGKELEKKTPFQTDSYFTSLAVDQDRIFLADAVHRQVLTCDFHGKYQAAFGKKDSSRHADGFIIPSPYFDLATGSFHELWVVNPGRLRLESYHTNGSFQSSWGKASHEDNGFTGCCNPAHIALLPDGSFVTYEKGIEKIKVFDPTGTFQGYVAGAGSFRGKTDFQTGNLNLVKDMTTDTEGNIYILDLYNQINIFRKKDK